MIPGLPSPYVLLAAAGIWLATAAGAFFYGSHVRGAEDAAAASAARAAHDAALLAANQRAADADAKSAEIARTADEKYNAYVAAADAGRDDFNRRLADSVRNARADAARRCELSSAAAGPGIAPSATTGSDDGYGGINPAAVQRVRDATVKLQAIVKTCVAWAADVGK